MSLPKPYYQDDAVQIFHADCRDILPSLPKVDLVLTDPPYGMNYQSNLRDDKYDYIKGDDKFPYTLMQNLMYDLYNLLNPDTAVYIFTQFHIYPKLLPLISDVFNVKNLLVWVKNHQTAGDLIGDYGRQYENIVFATKGKFRLRGSRTSNVLQFPIIEGSVSIHPTQKPDPLIKHLIQQSSDIGDIILDPFLGSGTTCFCAKHLGRKAIGIEIEEKYCEIAAKRMAQTVMELNI